MNTLLSGINILLTRPAHQNQSLVYLIEQQGGQCIIFPTIEIAPPTDSLAMREAIKNLAQYDYAIFLSANAVSQSAPLIHEYYPTIPNSLTIVAIGTGTKTALLQANLPVHIIPKTFNSEGLLALAEFQQIKDRQFAILTGENGRTFLTDILLSRGAHVNNIICYRRIMPLISDVERRQLLLHWNKLPIQLVIATSNESLENLIAMLGASSQTMLQQTTVLGMSQRFKEKAQELGLNKLIITETANDEGIIAALLKWKESLHDNQ